MTDAAEDRQLLDAIASEDIGGLETLVQQYGRGILSRKITLDSADGSGKWIALHIAVAMGRVHVVAWMLQQKTCRAHLLQRDSFDHRSSTVRSLREAHVQRRRTKGHDSPIALVEEHVSASAAAAEAIASAVGASRGKRKEDRPIHWHAVHWAAHCGQLEILQMLLKECQTPVSRSDAQGRERPCIGEDDWSMILQIASEQIQPLYLFTLTKKQRARERKGSQQVEESGQLFSWGSGAYYALGNGTDQSRREPRRVQCFSNVCVDLCAASKSVTLVRCSNPPGQSPSLLPGQQLWTWGTGFAGQLGHGDSCHVQAMPLALPPSAFARRRVSSLAAGREHSAFTTADGALYTFGGAGRGQLGHGNSIACSSPLLVKTFKRSKTCVRTVYCGAFHTLVVSRCGCLYAWGAGTMGETGLSILEDTDTPQKVPTFADRRVHMVAAGSQHTAVVLEDMDIFLTGFGECVPQRMKLPQGYPSVINQKLRAASRSNCEDSLLSITSVASGSTQTLICTNRGEVYYHRRVDSFEEALELRQLPLPAGASHVACGGGRTAVAVPQYKEVWEWDTVDKMDSCVPTKHRLPPVTGLVVSPKHTLALCSSKRRQTRVPVQPSTLVEDMARARSMFADVTIVPALEPTASQPCHRAMLAPCAGDALLRSLERSPLTLVALNCDGEDVEAFLSELYGSSVRHQQCAVAAEKVALAIGCSPPHTWQHISVRMGMIDKESFADMEIITATSRLFAANRFVLACRSPFFRRMLSDDFREATAANASFQINITGGSCEALLEYLYCDTLGDLCDPEQVIELYMVATYFCLERLLSFCERRLTEDLIGNDTLTLLKIWKAFGSDAIRNEILRYCIHSFTEVLQDGTFARLPTEIVQELQLNVDIAIERLLESQRDEGLPREHLLFMGRELCIGEELLEQCVIGMARSSQEASLKEERSVRKKLTQIEALYQQQKIGKVLTEAQRYKVHQRRPLLDYLSRLTKVPVEQIISHMVSSAAQQASSHHPQAHATLLPVGRLSTNEDSCALDNSVSLDVHDAANSGEDTFLREQKTEGLSGEPESVAEEPSDRSALSSDELSPFSNDDRPVLPSEIVEVPRRIGRKARRRHAKQKRIPIAIHSLPSESPVTPLKASPIPSSNCPNAVNSSTHTQLSRAQHTPYVSAESKDSIGQPLPKPMSFREIQEDEEALARADRGTAKRHRGTVKFDKKSPTVTIYYGSSPTSIPYSKRRNSPKSASPTAEMSVSPTWASPPLVGSPPVKSLLVLQQEEEEEKRRQKERVMRERQKRSVNNTARGRSSSWLKKDGSSPTGSATTVSLVEIQRQEEEKQQQKRQASRPNMRAILEEETLRARRARPSLQDIEEEMLALALQASLAEQ